MMPQDYCLLDLKMGEQLIYSSLVLSVIQSITFTMTSFPIYIVVYRQDPQTQVVKCITL